MSLDCILHICTTFSSSSSPFDRDLKEIGIEIVTRDIKVPTRYAKLDGSIKYAYVREYSLKAH